MPRRNVPVVGARTARRREDGGAGVITIVSMIIVAILCLRGASTAQGG